MLVSCFSFRHFKRSRIPPSLPIFLFLNLFCYFLFFNLAFLHPDHDEAQRQGDEKIRHLGWILLMLWTMVICWITKEYWFPGLFSNKSQDTNNNFVHKMRQWRDRSREKKLQRVNHQLDIEQKRREVEMLQKLYSCPDLYFQ